MPIPFVIAGVAAVVGIGGAVAVASYDEKQKEESKKAKAIAEHKKEVHKKIEEEIGEYIASQEKYFKNKYEVDVKVLIENSPQGSPFLGVISAMHGLTDVSKITLEAIDNKGNEATLKSLKEEILEKTKTVKLLEQLFLSMELRTISSK